MMAVTLLSKKLSHKLLRIAATHRQLIEQLVNSENDPFTNSRKKAKDICPVKTPNLSLYDSVCVC
jgi:hypothetical protein